MLPPQVAAALGLNRESTTLAWRTFVPDPALRFTPDVAPPAADRVAMTLRAALLF